MHIPVSGLAEIFSQAVRLQVTGARPGRNGGDLPLRVGIEELGSFIGYTPSHIGIGRVDNKGTVVPSSVFQGRGHSLFRCPNSPVNSTCQPGSAVWTCPREPWMACQGQRLTTGGYHMLLIFFFSEKR